MGVIPQIDSMISIQSAIFYRYSNANGRRNVGMTFRNGSCRGDQLHLLGSEDRHSLRSTAFALMGFLLVVGLLLVVAVTAG
ncbi:hypothetical protein [Pseudomonas fluorescens]|uniref:hypothetical protein n=1 Tax=Pseudomonas fluorescens TaxID=294 RepID=UPI0012426637|nr:hypothetical protein [Pseudomonas fluorescens]